CFLTIAAQHWHISSFPTRRSSDLAAEGKDQINVQTSKQRQEGSALKLDEIEYTQEDRMSTDFQEFDRVLGGGVVEGSLVLIGGDPGIGKSTLLLQVAMQLAQKQKILYVTGEESFSQIKMRAERLELNNDNFYLLADTNLALIAREIQRLEPDMVVIDSI